MNGYLPTSVRQNGSPSQPINVPDLTPASTSPFWPRYVDGAAGRVIAQNPGHAFSLTGKRYRQDGELDDGTGPVEPLISVEPTGQNIFIGNSFFSPAGADQQTAPKKTGLDAFEWVDGPEGRMIPAESVIGDVIALLGRATVEQRTRVLVETILAMPPQEFLEFRANAQLLTHYVSAVDAAEDSAPVPAEIPQNGYVNAPNTTVAFDNVSSEAPKRRPGRPPKARTEEPALLATV